MEGLRTRGIALAIALAGAVVVARRASSLEDGEARVILVTTDGLRWQDVFSGADASLITSAEGVAKPEELRATYWRESAEERREALLPFIWGTMARSGQIHGNQKRGSFVRVTNGKNFSYPGYNELLAGFPDPAIASNDKVPNRNATVLEWLAKKPAFEGRVAAFCSWDVFPYIIRRESSGVLVNAGWEPADRPASESEALGAEAGREIPAPWDACRFDVLTFHAALDHLTRRKPRVLYVSLGETDEWGHLGRYGEYLAAARRADGFVKRLWEAAQALPEYRGKTSLVVTTDHGRGAGHAWRDHNARTAGSENVWIAVLGPRTAALGESSGGDPLTQAQVAATVARLVGEDYVAAVPRAASPIERAFKD